MTELQTFSAEAVGVDAGPDLATFTFVNAELDVLTILLPMAALDSLGDRISRLGTEIAESHPRSN